MALKVNNEILKTIRYATGNQCRVLSVSEKQRVSDQKPEKAGSLTRHIELFSNKIWEDPCFLTP